MEFFTQPLSLSSPATLAPKKEIENAILLTFRFTVGLFLFSLTRSLIPVHKSRLYTRKLARVTHDRRVVNIRWPGNTDEQLVVSWKSYARASSTSWPVISAQKRTSNQ